MVRIAFERWIKNAEKKLIRVARKRRSLIQELYNDPGLAKIASQSFGDGKRNRQLWRAISNLKGDLDKVYKEVMI